MANLEMSFIPLRCMMLRTMVAFIKKRIKKSTISAINLWAKDGMTYSLPACRPVSLAVRAGAAEPTLVTGTARADACTCGARAVRPATAVGVALPLVAAPGPGAAALRK